MEDEMKKTNKQFASSLFYLEHNISIFTSVPLKRDTSDPIVNNIYPKSSFFVYAAHYYLSIFAIRLAISMSPNVELILIFDYLFLYFLEFCWCKLIDCVQFYYERFLQVVVN